DRVTVTGSTNGDGIYMASNSSSVTNSTSSGNSRYGFEISGISPVVTNNVAFANSSWGFWIQGGTSSPAQWATVAGNSSHDNTSGGFTINYSNVSNNTGYDVIGGAAQQTGFDLGGSTRAT